MHDVRVLFAIGMAAFFGMFLALWLASHTLAFDMNVITPLQLESIDAGEGVIDRDVYPTG